MTGCNVHKDAIQACVWLQGSGLLTDQLTVQLLKSSLSAAARPDMKGDVMLGPLVFMDSSEVAL